MCAHKQHTHTHRNTYIRFRQPGLRLPTTHESIILGDDIAPSSPFSPVLRSTLTPSTNHGHGDSKQIFGLLNFNEAHFRLPSWSPKLVAEWLVYK